MRCYVSGQVQGVFFRASARHEAERLGISGYARNLPDGRVEVLACGAMPLIEELCTWLSKGPAQAQVHNVSCEPADDDPPLLFSIG
ncbi:MAG: acylphosphatase [Gammaproteobacteria bacterium]|nr:acylphosphatase [Gammaproteobacteria bacterium]